MKETTTTDVLLIFVKKPEKGRVKTRLAESIGHQRALEVYRQLLMITKRETRDVEVDKQVWYSPAVVNDDIWSSPAYTKHSQQGEGLGKRMQQAFGQAFKKGYQKVVIIGSDCPYITADIINQAFAELENNDLVIGPSADGGYYLLGMAAYHPDLFDDKEWSSSSVLEQTLYDANEKELSVAKLPELNDVDTLEDLQAVAKDIYL